MDHVGHCTHLHHGIGKYVLICRVIFVLFMFVIRFSFDVLILCIINFRCHFFQFASSKILRIHKAESPEIRHWHECDVTGLLMSVDLEILCVPIKIIIIGWWIATRAKPTNKLLSVMPIMGNWISAIVKTMLPLFIN